MSFAFDPNLPLVIIRVELHGPSSSIFVRLALDTGATDTLVNGDILFSLGYDPTLAPEHFEVTTGSGVEFVPRLTLDKLMALGQERIDFPVLCHTLPPSAGVDGLLGLDFLRGHTLTIDFADGQITLA